MAEEHLTSLVDDLNVLKKKAHEFIADNLEDKTVVLLEGPMGVGKTQWVTFLLQGLGYEDACSPSFSIHNSYELPNGRIVDHLDLYRLENDEDLETTGFWDLFSRPHGLILIEWGDRLHKEFIPIDWSVFCLNLQRTGVAEQRRMVLSRRL